MSTKKASNKKKGTTTSKSKKAPKTTISKLKKNGKTTQTQAVLEHLERFGSITTSKAVEKYQAIRVSSIIYNLRKRGYDIETQEQRITNKQFGFVTNQAKYVLNS